jgi:short-subunit dehydrogenase
MMNLAIEMKEHGVHTTSYCPGGVATGMKVNNATYRPARFGGPGEGEVQVSDASANAKQMAFYSPDAVAPMVLRAVRNNRPFVFDHADQRRHFRETYANVVEACYDDIDAWEKEFGLPDANPTGAVLLDAN